MQRPSLGPRGIAVALAVAILLGAALYFAGGWQARSGAEAERSAFRSQLSQAEAELRRARAELAAAEDRNRLLLALGSLYEAALDLDRRNFGIANGHLDDAAEALAAVSDGSGAVDVAALRALQDSIAETDLNVATNLQQQRARVLELASRLEALLTPAPASAP